MTDPMVLAAAAGGVEPVFWIGPVPVSPGVVGQWLIMGFIILIAAIVARGFKPVPASRLQSLVEIALEGLLNLFGSVMDEQRARRFAALPISLFFFILLSNYSGMIPFLPNASWFIPPSSQWGVTLGLAIVVFVYVNFVAITSGGHHYRAWFDPWWLAWLRVPLGLIEELVRPFSLSLRLFANVFAGETVLMLLLVIMPYLLPAGVMGIELIMGAVQALIFSLLTTVYLAEASEHHGH